MSSSASSKKSASPDLPLRNFSAIAASYAVLFLIAWSKIVGFEVSPVTESSSMYCLSVPLSSRSRVMLVQPETLAQVVKQLCGFHCGSSIGAELLASASCSFDASK